MPFIISIKMLILLAILQLGLAATIREGRKVLLLLDDWNITNSHTKFIEQIKQQKYSVDIEMASQQNIQIQEFDEFLYNAIVVMAPSIGNFGSNVGVKVLQEFFDAGGNLIVFGDTDASYSTRDLANQFGLDFFATGHRVYQKYKKDGSDQNRDICITDNILKSTPIAPAITAPIYFRGLPMHKESNNTLTRSVLRGDKSCFVQNELKSGERHSVRGEQLLLSASVQGLNNARAVFFGGVEICSDNIYNQYPGNQQLMESLLQWSLNMTGRLRYHSITHYTIHNKVTNEKVEPGSLPKGTQEAVYKKFDELYFSVDIEEYDPINKKWNPFVASDLQIEYVMLDPYYRLNLIQKPGTSTYYVTFQVPDQHGTFKFRLQYKKTGYSWLHFENVAPVRHLKHTEVERFLKPAYPYYSAVFTSIISFLIFTPLIYLHGNKNKKE